MHGDVDVHAMESLHFLGNETMKADRLRVSKQGKCPVQRTAYILVYTRAGRTSYTCRYTTTLIDRHCDQCLVNASHSPQCAFPVLPEQTTFWDAAAVPNLQLPFAWTVRVLR